MPGGTVLVEVGDGQARPAAALATESGFAAIDIHQDLSGKERVVGAALPGAAILELSDLDGPRCEALASALQSGAIIGLPTDTVYGLGAAWNSRDGVRRLFAAKGRDDTEPVAVLFSSAAAVREAIPDLGLAAARVLDALLPGPFTFIVSTATARPSLVGTEDSLGVRVPDHPPLLTFLGSLSVALAATSANISGQAAAASLDHVDSAVLAYCSAALVSSNDIRPAGVASTVVDLRPLLMGGRPEVLREGSVTTEEVLRRIDSL
jgi:L-threonylcarbamoyladenylate synthase